MSYDIRLKDPKTGETVLFKEPHEVRGGTYCLGGTTEAWLNVTYNYGSIFRRDNVLGKDGIRTIYGMTGEESIPVLTKAINNLNKDTDPDYWEATEGNARKALENLRILAAKAPYGIWDGD